MLYFRGSAPDHVTGPHHDGCRPTQRSPPAPELAPMASLPRKSRLQCCWQLLEDLAFSSGRWPRLSALAAQVLFEQQLAVPAMPIDPELDGLLP